MVRPQGVFSSLFLFFRVPVNAFELVFALAFFCRLEVDRVCMRGSKVLFVGFGIIITVLLIVLLIRIRVVKYDETLRR